MLVGGGFRNGKLEREYLFVSKRYKRDVPGNTMNSKSHSKLKFMVYL